MVYGDKRPHLVGILVPDPEWVAEWAKENGIVYNYDALLGNDAMRSALRAAVDRVNTDLSVIEKVRKFDLASEAFTIENEQMTPSLKIRRHVLKDVYADKIAAMYKN
jgi:long-chain acyl-CoA synthetase